MGTIDSMKSILTQSALDALCEKFHIPDNVYSELPGPNDRIRNVGYYDLDENCYPNFWAGDDEEMDLFAFINHADPTKVWIGEREIQEGDHVIQDEGADFVRVEDEVSAAAAEKAKVS
nr:hypothetical protein CTI12_AA075910 [Tanacetum cinerariifolium]